MVSANVRNILKVPIVKERDVKKIHEFYETLLFNVESFKDIARYLYTLDKLQVIKNELAMANDNWGEWTWAFSF